jgi:hypothetical protein
MAVSPFYVQVDSTEPANAPLRANKASTQIKISRLANTLQYTYLRYYGEDGL